MKRLESWPWQPPRDSFLSQPLPRRRALGVLGGLAALLATDSLIGKLEYGGTSPVVESLTDPEVAQRHPHTWCLTIGGFGVHDTRLLAASTRPALREYGQPAVLKNAAEALQMTDIEQTITRFAEKQKATRINLYGQSMGGMEAIDVACRLQAKGFSVPAIFLDCTPLDRLDVRAVSRRGADVMEKLDEYQLEGGPLTRFGIEYVERAGQGRADYVSMCLEALRSLGPDNCSTALLASQAAYINQFNARSYAGRLAGDTQIIKLQPDNLDNDTTVDNAAALRRLRQEFVNNPVYEQSVAGGGHANSFEVPAAYTAALLEAGQACALDDGRDHHTARLLHETG